MNNQINLKDIKDIGELHSSMKAGGVASTVFINGNEQAIGVEYTFSYVSGRYSFFKTKNEYGVKEILFEVSYYTCGLCTHADWNYGLIVFPHGWEWQPYSEQSHENMHEFVVNMYGFFMNNADKLPNILDGDE